jgi:hypothetical protein
MAPLLEIEDEVNVHLIWSNADYFSNTVLRGYLIKIKWGQDTCEIIGRPSRLTILLRPPFLHPCISPILLRKQQI